MHKHLSAVALALAIAPACRQPVLPEIEHASFVEGVGHPFFPLPTGGTWTLEARTDAGLERVDFEVLADTREVSGIAATQLKQTVFANNVESGRRTELFAEDINQNVWFLGREACVIEGDECAADADESWEVGVDDAQPGFAMPGQMTTDGNPWYREFREGRVENVARFVDLSVTASTADRDFDDCVQTGDSSTLDPDVHELKTYCRFVGLVLVEDVANDVRVEMLDTSLD